MKGTIHGNKGESSYFQGEYAVYGRHQWNVKLGRVVVPEGLDFDQLHEGFIYYFLDDVHYITDELGRDKDGEQIMFSLEGRSSGWLVSDNNLAQAQIDYITLIASSITRHFQNYITQESEDMV